MRRLVILQHLDREGPGLFANIAIKRGYTLNTCRLDLGDKIPRINNKDIVLIMGGPMGIRDIGSVDYPWLTEELKLIKYALLNNIRIIGVCLGAQLLAHSYGLKVEPLRVNGQEKLEVGWSTIFKNNKSKLENLFFDQKLDVLHWHGDRILMKNEIQNEFDLIASSQLCKEQFFKIKSYAFGLQFHVETEPYMLLKWIKEDKEFIRKALGNKAESILLKQHQKFSTKSLKNRISFINRLYDVYENC